MAYLSNDSPDEKMESIDHLFNESTELMTDQDYEELRNEFNELD